VGEDERHSSSSEVEQKFENRPRNDPALSSSDKNHPTALISAVPIYPVDNLDSVVEMLLSE
jgi:hypothetical protein